MARNIDSLAPMEICWQQLIERLALAYWRRFCIISMVDLRRAGGSESRGGLKADALGAFVYQCAITYRRITKRLQAAERSE